MAIFFLLHLEVSNISFAASLKRRALNLAARRCPLYSYQRCWPFLRVNLDLHRLWLFVPLSFSSEGLRLLFVHLSQSSRGRKRTDDAVGL